MNRKEWKESIEKTAEDALFAFWEVVAKAYPQAKGGEFGIGETFEMHQMAEEFIAHWLDLNHPTYREERESA